MIVSFVELVDFKEIPLEILFYIFIIVIFRLKGTIFALIFTGNIYSKDPFIRLFYRRGRYGIKKSD